MKTVAVPISKECAHYEYVLDFAYKLQLLWIQEDREKGEPIKKTSHIYLGRLWALRIISETVALRRKRSLPRAINPFELRPLLDEHSAAAASAVEMWEAYHERTLTVTISPMETNWVVRILSDRIFNDIESFNQFVLSGELARLLNDRFHSEPQKEV